MPAQPSSPELLRHAWVEYRTPSFSLLTDLDSEQALRSVHDIERFARVVREVLGLGHRPVPILAACRTPDFMCGRPGL